MCQEVKKVMESWQYDETDLERLSLIMMLYDLDFTVEEIEKYMKLSLKKNENECLKLLNKKRKGILDEVHLKEKQLLRIDYLRYEMDWENKE
ncbi:MerR family transcriptional regulator [Faecalibacillus intestinalis]|uniref:MerR family transcriptional regulator n=2 Tax=Faecalibacillus intestinalis TaxID=1982626 RepID=UPI00295F491A|nr:MerR family transcriptional regulator [Faecalibacillus intestinalis]